MNTLLSAPIKSWFKFFGTRTIIILAASLVLAVIMFFIEYLFAHSLQAFLSVLGILKQEIISGPLPLDPTRPGWIVFILIILTIVRGLVLGCLSMLRGVAEDGFRKDLRIRLLTWSFESEGTRSSDVVRRFTEVANATSNAVMCLQIALANGVAVLLVAAYLMWKTPMLLGMLAIGACFLLLPSHFVDRSIRRDGETIERQWTEISETLLRSLEGRRLLRIHGLITDAIKRLHGRLQSHHDVMMHYHLLASLKLVLPQTFGVALVCGIAFIARDKLELDASVLVVAFYLLLRVVQMFSQAVHSSSRLLLFWPQVVSLHAWWIEAEKTALLKRPAACAPLPSGPLGFEFTSVSHFYPGSAEGNLEIPSLRIAPGSIVIIGGPSGSGKSTLISLMLGLLDPIQGKVEVLTSDGSRNSLQSTRDTLLDRTGYAEADSYLFPGTIIDNLSSGVQEKPEDNVINMALNLAHIDFLDNKLDGYKLTERGAGISAGQRQRLGIARALLRKPDLLMLDEATSNLDAATERKILKAITGMPNRPTVILVSHRSTATEFADLVINVHDGMVCSVKTTDPFNKEGCL